MNTATSCENAFDKVLLDMSSTRHFHVPFGDFHGLGRGFRDLGRGFRDLVESVLVPKNKSHKERTKRWVTFSEINSELLTRVDQFQFNLCTCNPNLRSSVLFLLPKKERQKKNS